MANDTMQDFFVKMAAKEGEKDIEQKRLKPEEKTLMELAHPNPVFVAESQGEGGLVENQYEMREKFLEVANKMPTGSLTGKHANIFMTMIKTAEMCEEIGQEDASILLTLAAQIISDKLTGPLV